MHQDLQADYRNHVIRNRRKNVLKKIVSAMGCLVVFCTTYALILPAITMENKAYCGEEEHVHSEACYSQTAAKVLVCSAEHFEIHSHDAGCYAEDGRVTCGMADYLIHSHDENCYDRAGQLVCTLSECGAHVHGDACYVPGETQEPVLHVHSEACYTSERGDLVCEVEEYEGHAHNADCYAISEELACVLDENHVHGDSCYTYPLVCTQSTDPHSHGDGCYGTGNLLCSIPEGHVHGDGCWETVLACDSSEEGHEHGDGCYTRNLTCSVPENHAHAGDCYESIIVCGKEEGQAHAHGDGCYSAEAELVCTKAENHVHDTACYRQDLICEIPEDPGHAHEDACYQWNDVLSCGLEEGEPEPTEPAEPVLACTEPVAQSHVHGEACFEEKEPEFVTICGNTAEDHTHTAECYEIVCGLEEHTHTMACWSDPEADVESPAVWEATFADVELTGNWNEDVIAIAKTQLGYAESTRNYAVWEDETIHGYTRYGAWYGVPHGDWCGMFVSFCIYYADVKGMPLNYGVRPWIEELTELELYHVAEEYEPKTGDLIFYDWEGDDLSDHVGLVAEIIPATETEPVRIKAIEGNSANCVQYVYYDFDDSQILGYSELPENSDLYFCGYSGHVHNEYCVDGCTKTEHIHDDSCMEEPVVYYCGLNEHVHSEECLDEEGNRICGLEEHTHDDACLTAPVTYYCGLNEHVHSEECLDEEGNQICGLEEHTHDEACLTAPVTYYCGLNEHVHSEECLDEEGNQICGLEEHAHNETCLVEPVTYFCGLMEHTHNEECVNEEGALICGLTEHAHTEECTVEPPVYYCGKEEHVHSGTCFEDGNLVCTKETHLHTDSCLKEIIYYCGQEEHTHDEACYDADGNLICTLAEHTHTEECTVQPVYYCGKEEHTHGEACYDAEGMLICTLEEHIHDAGCTIEIIYYCGKEEHTHGEACYDADGNLICTLEEHTHTEECTVQPVYYCGKVEHTHGESCYDAEGNLICTLEEHVHDETCKIEPDYFCGREAHTHGETCYDAEGNLICPLKEHVHTAECMLEPVYLCGFQAHTHGEGCYDEAGELICELPEHVHTAVCEGYTCGMEFHVHGSACYDASGTLICLIREHEHDSLCDNYICGKIPHTHDAHCYDAEGNLICTLEEHTHTMECLAFKLVYSDANMEVTATITGVEELPEELQLVVVPVTKTTSPELFASMQGAVNKEMASSNQYAGAVSFFDLKLQMEEEPYTLPENALITVTMEFNEPIFTAEAVKESMGTQTFMLTPEKVKEEPAEDASETPAEQEQVIPEETEDAEEPSVVDSVLNVISNVVNELIPSASAAETDGESGAGESAEDGFQISGVTGEDYGNQSQGITSVTFQANQLSTFGVALANDSAVPVYSPYWQRIESEEELQSAISEGGQFMIISAEGNYALLSQNSDNSIPVTMTPIKGFHNRQYYEIELGTYYSCGMEEHTHTNSCKRYSWSSIYICGYDYEHTHASDCEGAPNNLLWTFTHKGDSSYEICNVQNPGTTAEAKTYLSLGNNVTSTTAGNCTLNYLDTNNENCWNISGSRYLRFHENYGTTFQSSNDANSNWSSSTSAYGKNFYNARNMLIFRMLPEDTAFSIPADVVAKPSSGSDTAEGGTKPNYGSFVGTSDGKQGGTSLGTVSGQYYSDPATSQLEQHFRKETYEESKSIDGMVRTDKSVIYGDDDYDAFTGYASNTFSVTLSALGQAYPIPENYQVDTPVDVVFVLDCSSSMSNEKAGSVTRAVAMVDALNAAMEDLLYKTVDGVRTPTENRVGVVFYAAGAKEILPVGQYDTAPNSSGEYIYFDTVRTTNNAGVVLTSQNTTIDRVVGNSNLVQVTRTKVQQKNEDGTPVVDENGKYVYTTQETRTSKAGVGQIEYDAAGNIVGYGSQGYGTYTQAGIAMGSKVFHDVTDRTYTASFGDANNTTVTVQRQPVFVLLSDGEPTYSTNMYMDALNGVHYGDGNGGANLVKGIHGYYTILSANYYKRMVGIHYDTPALFYTIALGITSGGSTDGTSHDYKLAVLNPTSTNVGKLANDSRPSTAVATVTSRELYALLNDSNEAQSIKTYANWPDDWTGVPHTWEPIMPNPYAGNYSYTDEAFSGNYDSTALANVFKEIIQASRNTETYGFVLFENTGVHMTDYIGAGMEVQGAPVLRYGGANYYATNPDGELVTNIVDGEEVVSRKYTYTGTYHDPYIPNKMAVDLSQIEVYITTLEHTPIYMCGNNAADHTHDLTCGIYRSYLCGHHSHRKSCYVGDEIGYYDENNQFIMNELDCEEKDHDHANCVEINTTQRIQMIVPDTALPVYTPDLGGKFYYEALPVRLIYQVGLSADATDAVLKLAEDGGEMTFYTNRWGGTEHARSDLIPSDVNPFYWEREDIAGTPHYKDHTNSKSENTTGTEGYAVDCHWALTNYIGQETGHVYHELGNNGKLVFRPDVIDIPVEKNWSEGSPAAEMPEKVEVVLYRVTPSVEEGKNPTGKVFQTGTITEADDGSWSYTFEDVPVPTGTWYYAIAETPVEGFDTSYPGGETVTITIPDGKDEEGKDKTRDIQAVKVAVITAEDGTVTVTPTTVLNTYQWKYELPKTGGAGVTPYHALGMAFLVTAGALYTKQKKSKRERG